MAEGDRGIAPKLAGDLYLRVGDCIAGPFMDNLGLDGEQFARCNEAAHFGFLDRRQKRHSLELHKRKQEPTGGLRHRLDQQHTGHDRVAGEMPLENSTRLWNLCFDRDGLLFRVEVENTIDKLEVIEL